MFEGFAIIVVFLLTFFFMKIRWFSDVENVFDYYVGGWVVMLLLLGVFLKYS